VTNVTATPPGWYPDPHGGPAARWWDGVQWTDHHMPIQGVLEPLKAPAGTKTNTVWIWLVALLPLLSLSTLFLIDFNGYMNAAIQNPTSPTGVYGALFTPGYILATVLSWVSVILTIVFGYVDFRTLRARGVPQPFHWAFGFLVLASAGIVYPIGRSVVVRRRAGGSMAPMYVAIAVYVVIIVVAIVWTAVITSQMFATIANNPSLYT